MYVMNVSVARSTIHNLITFIGLQYFPKKIKSKCSRIYCWIVKDDGCTKIFVLENKTYAITMGTHRFFCNLEKSNKYYYEQVKNKITIRYKRYV